VGELPITVWSCCTGAADIPNANARQFGGSLNFGLDFPKMQRLSKEVVRPTPPAGVSGGAIFEICNLAAR
jgi:hypothetical protein